MVFLFVFPFLRKGNESFMRQEFVSFSSESSLRENMVEGGGSSTQCMQTGVGGFLLLMRKVG